MLRSVRERFQEGQSCRYLLITRRFQIRLAFQLSGWMRHGGNPSRQRLKIADEEPKRSQTAGSAYRKCWHPRDSDSRVEYSRGRGSRFDLVVVAEHRLVDCARIFRRAAASAADCCHAWWPSLHASPISATLAYSVIPQPCRGRRGHPHDMVR
jgi:hypothetical protein